MSDTGKFTEFVQGDIDLELLGSEPKYTRAQIAELAGVELERGQRLWVAMGFPINTDADAVMFTDADVRALKDITGLVEQDIVEQSMEVAIARTLGQSMSRLAEWQVGVVNSYIVGRMEEQTAAGEPPDLDAIRADARRMASETVPTLERLQSYAWRRHLAAVSGRALSAAGQSDSTRVETVGFADMVGYTSLTRQIGVDELTALLEEFESVAMEAIARGRGSVVKTVGDEVMFQTQSPADAARIGLALQSAFSGREDFPKLRVGLAYGPVLARFGDLYGSTVNIAARLTSAAHPGSVLADSDFADAVSDESEFHLKSLRPIRVRGFKRLKPFVVRPNRDSNHREPSSS